MKSITIPDHHIQKVNYNKEGDTESVVIDPIVDRNAWHDGYEEGRLDGLARVNQEASTYKPIEEIIDEWMCQPLSLTIEKQVKWLRDVLTRVDKAAYEEGVRDERVEISNETVPHSLGEGKSCQCCQAIRLGRSISQYGFGGRPLNQERE
jgi:hypothetical protein